MTFNRSAAVFVGAAALLCGTATYSGCTTYSPGGSGHADDTYTYYSTPHQPQSVTVVDTRTGQALWTYEIPVNRQLTVSFYEDQYPDSLDNPARMHWREFEIGTSQGKLTSQMAVPDRRNRRVDVSVRSYPEYPKAAAGGSR